MNKLTNMDDTRMAFEKASITAAVTGGATGVLFANIFTQPTLSQSLALAALTTLGGFAFKKTFLKAQELGDQEDVQKKIIVDARVQDAIDRINR